MAALTLCACGRSPLSGQAPAARNLLLVTVDTLRADHLGCYGHAGRVTPAIDALAEHGVLFEQAHTPVPLTLPAHTALLTGTYPPCNHVRDNGLDQLGEEYATLAAHLAARGRATAAVIGSLVLERRYGLARGFDHYDDVLGVDANGGPRLERPAGEVTDRALEWLAEHGERPFFLWVHYFDPHQPYAPPEPFAGSHAADPYSGEIAYADREIGRLLASMERTDLLESTLVVLAGDHGEGLGEHGEQTHGVLAYEATLHVPLIFAHPSLPQGMRLPGPVALPDVSPTILAILGQDPLANAQGVSLATTWSAGGQSRHDDIYFETLAPYDSFGWSPLAGIISGRFKLIQSPRPELYDLIEDPHEQHDLSGADPERLAALQRRLMGLRHRLAPEDSGLLPRALRPRLTPEDRARFAALGYLLAGAGKPGGKPLADPKDKIDLAEKLLALVLAYEQGHFEEVRREARNLLDANEDCFLARAMSGLCMLQEARELHAGGRTAAARQALEEAVAMLERALDLNGDWVDLHHQIALAYERLGRGKRAIAHWRRCLVLQPAFAPPYRRLGLVAESQGRAAAALRDYRAFLARSTGDDAASRDTRRRIARLEMNR